MKNKKIIVTGGTGFIGQALAKYFGKENHVVILSRQSVNSQNNKYDNNLATANDGYDISYCRWDANHVEKHWAQEIDGADIVINLTGKSVNCRYTEKNKREIFDSRINATRTIGQAIRESTAPPKLWINAASATTYRHAPDKPQDEHSGVISDKKADNMPYSALDQLRWRYKRFKTHVRYGKESKQYQDLDLDFSVQVCKLWEKAFFEQRTPFTRKIGLRTAITLGAGGVIVPYFNLLKFGLGGHQGNGRQMYSWVHIEDVCRAIAFCTEHAEMEGVYNLSSPNAVTNDAFMSTLRKITGYKIGIPAPAMMLEMGAALIGTETELILKSRWVLPTKLLQEGFQFKYPKLEDALIEIVNNSPRKAYRLF